MYIVRPFLTVLVPASGRSDGLVPETSAKMIGACDIEVVNANHWELLNHPNTTVAYIGIMQGDFCASQTGSFFITN